MTRYQIARAIERHLKAHPPRRTINRFVDQDDAAHGIARPRR